jgi:hypothetical protein
VDFAVGTVREISIYDLDNMESRSERYQDLRRQVEEILRDRHRDRDRVYRPLATEDSMYRNVSIMRMPAVYIDIDAAPGTKVLVSRPASCGWTCFVYHHLRSCVSTEEDLEHLGRLIMMMLTHEPLVQAYEEYNRATSNYEAQDTCYLSTSDRINRDRFGRGRRRNADSMAARAVLDFAYHVRTAFPPAFGFDAADMLLAMASPREVGAYNGGLESADSAPAMKVQEAPGPFRLVAGGDEIEPGEEMILVHVPGTGLAQDPL